MREHSIYSKLCVLWTLHIVICRRIILGLAGMESTFPTAAHTVFCSAFVAKTALILQQCFFPVAEKCWLRLPRLISITPKQQVMDGQELGREYYQDRWPKLTKGYSIIMMSCSAMGGKQKEMVECSLWKHLSLQETAPCTEALFPKMWPKISCWWVVEDNCFILLLSCNLCFFKFPLIGLVFNSTHNFFFFSSYFLLLPFCVSGVELPIRC